MVERKVWCGGVKMTAKQQIKEMATIIEKIKLYGTCERLRTERKKLKEQK